MGSPRHEHIEDVTGQQVSAGGASSLPPGIGPPPFLLPVLLIGVLVFFAVSNGVLVVFSAFDCVMIFSVVFRGVLVFCSVFYGVLIFLLCLRLHGPAGEC